MAPGDMFTVRGEVVGDPLGSLVWEPELYRLGGGDSFMGDVLTVDPRSVFTVFAIEHGQRNNAVVTTYRSDIGFVYAFLKHCVKL